MSGNGVTWKWIAAALLALILSIGGYQWTQLDKRVAEAQDAISYLEAQQSAIHAVLNTRFDEVIRRLDRIERALDNTGTSSNRGFPTTKK